MHHDEIASDEGLVRRLIEAQFPQWQGLPVRRVHSTGTSNALYRLGEDMVIRLPLRPSSNASLEREHRWLPFLAPQLPVEVPIPLARGAPSDEFEWEWSVYSWFDGDDGVHARVDPQQLAGDLAGFLRALRAIDPSGGPPPKAASSGRGVDLARRDEMTRQAIRAAAHLVDADAVSAAWAHALGAGVWPGPPTWLHGDLASANLIFRDGHLSAVIDFGCVGVGDPACDLLVAWELFDPETRPVFRDQLGADDESWARGRGWALSTAIVALPYYEGTNEFMVRQALHKIVAVLDDLA